MKQAEVIYLDIPSTSQAELSDLLYAETEKRNQRNGKFNGIVDFLKKLAGSIESNWEDVTKNFYLANLSASQVMYGFMMKNAQGEYIMIPPNVIPFKADINHIYESRDITQDSPMNEIENFILFDIINNSPASLSRRPFGPRKELAPRLRFYIQTNDFQYPVSAKRKEFIIRFKAYAHSTEEAQLLIEGLEYFFDIKKEILYGLGAQKFYVMPSSIPTKEDKTTNMAVRQLDLYLRSEQWYIGEGAVTITSIEMDWINRLDSRF